MRWIFLVMFIGVVGYVPAQTNFTHLSLTVDFDARASRVHGHVDLLFTTENGVDSVYLNGIKMNYSEVLLNDRPATYAKDDKGIWILSDSLQKRTTNKLSITYSCQPRRGIFFFGFNDKTNRARKQIWTQGQGIDHRHWIPHKDDQTDKVIIDLSITAKDNFQVMANGVLTGKSVKSLGETQWQYSMEKPMPSYLLALAIAEYDTINTQSATSIPLTQYFYPERKEDYQIYYASNEHIFNFLENKIGVPYPWQNYKQAPVVNFQHGAMENTTATIFGDFFMADSIAVADRNYPYVNAHELAHQWFGNLVTAKNSNHHWLHEGFATYYQWLAEEEIYGTAHFDWQRKLGADMIFEAAKYDQEPLMSGKAGSARFYQKGAWVLYMLNQKAETFDAIIKSYVEENAVGVVETDDLQSIFETKTKQDFSQFFDVWVKQPQELDFTVNQLGFSRKKVQLEFIPKNEPSENQEVTLRIVYTDGEQEDLKVASKEVTFKSDKAIAFWEVNPNMEKLLQVAVDKPEGLWEKQYAHYASQGFQKNLLSRYEALFHLSEKKHADLLMSIAVNTKEFFALRALALKKLVEADYAEYQPLLLSLLEGNAKSQSAIQFKKEAVLLVDDKQPQTLSALEQLRFEKSYVLRERVMHKSIQPTHVEANRWLYDERYRQQPGIEGQNVYVNSLLYRVLLFKDAEALDSLVDRTSVSFDFLTRINAMEGLLAVGLLNKKMLPHLFEGLFNTNRKLLRSARSVLKTYAEDEKNRRLIESYINENEASWSDFQKRLVARTFDR